MKYPIFLLPILSLLLFTKSAIGQATKEINNPTTVVSPNLLLPVSITPNPDTLLYTNAPPIKDTAKRKKNRVIDILGFLDFYTTFTSLHTRGDENAEPNNMHAYYNITINNQIKYKKFKWDTYLFNDLGGRYYFDSTIIKAQDQLNFKNAIFFKLFQNKIHFSITVNSKSQLWPGYTYKQNSNGTIERLLANSYLSPGQKFYSGGLTYDFGEGATVSIGLGSGKILKFINQKIYDIQKKKILGGVEKGERKKIDFGINIISTVPLVNFKEKYYWEFYSNIFMPTKDMDKLVNYTFEVNNALHAKLFKYVRVSWRTKLNIDKNLSEKPILINQISLGFYLTNIIN
jgi:hypothetical protein